MTPNETITEMLKQMQAAEKSGLTAEEEIQADAAKSIGLAIERAIFAVHKDNGGVLDSAQCLHAVAVSFGLAIKVNRNAGPLSGALIAMEYLQTILHIATEE